MRTSALVVSAACLLTGCESDSLTAPVSASEPAPVVASVVAQPATPRIFACRGGSTIADPLFVVDGTIARFDAVSQLDPEAIESIEVIKGTAASAVYGSRASLGVVLITTRGGRPRAARSRRVVTDGRLG